MHMCFYYGHAEENYTHAENKKPFMHAKGDPAYII